MYFNTYEVYRMPVQSILSKQASKIYETLCSAKEISLNEFCEKLSNILKQTFEYNFAISKNYTNELINNYNLKMKPVHPSLKGICRHASNLGLLLIKSLSDELEVSKIKTKILINNKNKYHSIIIIKSSDIYKFINPLSAFIPFGLADNEEKIRELGFFRKAEKIQNNYDFKTDKIIKIRKKNVLVTLYKNKKSGETKVFLGQCI